MFAALNQRIANILPGLKTRLCLFIGGVATFTAAVDPNLVAPIIPPSWQPYMPLVFFGAAYYAHHLTPLHQ